VPARLSAAERVRAEIDELFASEQDLGEVLEEVARLSVRLVIQAAVEAEVTEFLGRDRYARGERERAGHRNGHAELTVKTTAGPVVLARPKLRGTDQPFTSRLLGKGVSRTNASEALVVSGFVRGLSVRDVEAALAEALGRRRPCRSRPSAASARRSRPSSTPGSGVIWAGSSWSICSWTAPSSGCTRALGPSRCCAPGPDHPRPSGAGRAGPGPARATTLGPASWRT
jgi:putative transposase